MPGGVIRISIQTKTDGYRICISINGQINAMVHGRIPQTIFLSGIWKAPSDLSVMNVASALTGDGMTCLGNKLVCSKRSKYAM